jgi:hypothetical protein
MKSDLFDLSWEQNTPLQDVFQTWKLRVITQRLKDPRFFSKTGLITLILSFDNFLKVF